MSMVQLGPLSTCTALQLRMVMNTPSCDTRMPNVLHKEQFLSCILLFWCSGHKWVVHTRFRWGNLREQLCFNANVCRFVNLMAKPNRPIFWLNTILHVGWHIFSSSVKYVGSIIVAISRSTLSLIICLIIVWHTSISESVFYVIKPTIRFIKIFSFSWT